MMGDGALPMFDRELSLEELLRGINLPKLQQAIGALLGESATVSDPQGRVLLGNGEQARPAHRLPLRGQLDSLGYLEADPAPERLRPVADILEILLHVNTRYLMASDLHLRAVEEDFEELQRKHQALMESEARYKALAENLEQRVDEQVKTIETAQRQLYASEKLASVGRLAAGMAHEINTPIGFTKSNLSTAGTYLQELKQHIDTAKSNAAVAAAWQGADLDFLLDDFSALLQESLDGVSRVARIVADLRGFACIDQGDKQSTDINAVIRQTCNIAAAQIPERIRIVQDLRQVPWLSCHAAQIGQVIYNLLLNAVDAIADQGEIRFATEVAEGAVRVQVKDSGAGIPADAIPHIFDWFFTTKDVGSGTGLGLSVCHDVIRHHGGTITVASAQGAGTTFTITLPLSGAAA